MFEDQEREVDEINSNIIKTKEVRVGKFFVKISKTCDLNIDSDESEDEDEDKD